MVRMCRGRANGKHSHAHYFGLAAWIAGLLHGSFLKVHLNAVILTVMMTETMTLVLNLIIIA